jgi:hypothetical protein
MQLIPDLFMDMEGNRVDGRLYHCHGTAKQNTASQDVAHSESHAEVDNGKTDCLSHNASSVFENDYH